MDTIRLASISKVGGPWSQSVKFRRTAYDFTGLVVTADIRNVSHPGATVTPSAPLTLVSGLATAILYLTEAQTTALGAGTCLCNVWISQPGWGPYLGSTFTFFLES